MITHLTFDSIPGPTVSVTAGKEAFSNIYTGVCTVNLPFSSFKGDLLVILKVKVLVTFINLGNKYL